MSLFYVSPWTHKKHPDTLDCAFLLLWTSCWWRWQFSIPGCSGVVDMSSYCLEKCRLKVDITCVQMRISFSFPTNMCKHELDCFQVTFFFLWNTENSSQKLPGENFSWHIYIVKKDLIAHLQSHMTVLCTSVRLKNRNTHSTRQSSLRNKQEDWNAEMKMQLTKEWQNLLGSLFGADGFWGCSREVKAELGGV